MRPSLRLPSPWRFVSTLLISSLAAQTLPPNLAQRPVVGCTLHADPGDGLFAGALWSATVPYEYATGVTAAQQTAMRAAMQELETVINVQFVPRANEPDFIHIQDSTINSSAVGRVGGIQIVHVFNWNSRFQMVHELVHVLGFWHEQQRPDRDTYVTVQWNNVLATEAVGFQIVPTGQTRNAPYDFDSVMHFAANEGSANGQPTILVNPPNQPQQAAIGQRTHLSVGDVTALRLTYGSSVPPTLTTSTPSSTTVWLPAPLLLDGQLLDEAFRVWFGTTAINNFTRPTPGQIQFSLPGNLNIGNYQVAVESHTGRSNAITVQLTGNEPPIMELPPLLVRGLALPVRIHSDNVRTNLLLFAFDNQPSVLAGVINLGLGTQFTTLGSLGTRIGDLTGQSIYQVTVPTRVPASVTIYFQSVLYDPANLTPPLPVSTVHSTRTF